MPPRFFYFDLGRVLINFDVQKMLDQLATVCGADAARVKEIVFDSGMQTKYESGLIDCREFHEQFNAAIGLQCDFEKLRLAASDIFELNVGIVAIAAQLRASGCRMGILSNTCHAHWEFCLRRYPSVIGLFDVHALSYRLKAVKPQAAIFESAAVLAGVEAGEIFFVDDMPGHVEAARAVGFDAVQYTGDRRLVADLRSRAVEFNY